MHRDPGWQLLTLLIYGSKLASSSSIQRAAECEVRTVRRVRGHASTGDRRRGHTGARPGLPSPFYIHFVASTSPAHLFPVLTED